MNASHPLSIEALPDGVARRYPRRLFDVNVGVLRWTWRVAADHSGTPVLVAGSPR